MTLSKLRVANHSDTKLKMNPRFWATFCGLGKARAWESDADRLAGWRCGFQIQSSWKTWKLSYAAMAFWAKFTWAYKFVFPFQPIPKLLKIWNGKPSKLWTTLKTPESPWHSPPPHLPNLLPKTLERKLKEIRQGTWSQYQSSCFGLAVRHCFVMSCFLFVLTGTQMERENHRLLVLFISTECLQWESSDQSVAQFFWAANCFREGNDERQVQLVLWFDQTRSQNIFSGSE